MSQENVEIVRRSIAAFNENGIAGAAKYVHPDIVFEEPPTQPGSKTAHGAEDARGTFSAFDDTWEEHRSEIEEIRDLPNGDVLALTIEHLRGRDGIAFSQPCGCIYTLDGGLIIRLRPFWDRADAFKAAGLEEWTMSQANLEVVRRVYEAVAAGDSEAVLAQYHPDVEHDFSHSPFASVLDRSVFHGHEGLRNFMRERYDAFEITEDDCQELIDAGDKVIAVVTSRGRGRGSGLDVEQTHYAVWTIGAGKVTRVTWFGTRGEALEAAARPA